MPDQPGADRPGSLDVLGMTARIVSAHVSNNPVDAGDVPALIGEVYRSLAGMGHDRPVVAVAVRPEPAVPVKKSIQPDHLVCLEDGMKLKMLKRHLKTAYDMSPEQYRERWGLPADYPMVAPSYSSRRSLLAKEIGLGRKARDLLRSGGEL